MLVTLLSESTSSGDALSMSQWSGDEPGKQGPISLGGVSWVPPPTAAGREALLLPSMVARVSTTAKATLLATGIPLGIAIIGLAIAAIGGVPVGGDGAVNRSRCVDSAPTVDGSEATATGAGTDVEGQGEEDGSMSMAVESGGKKKRKKKRGREASFKRAVRIT